MKAILSYSEGVPNHAPWISLFSPEGTWFVPCIATSKLAQKGPLLGKGKFSSILTKFKIGPGGPFFGLMSLVIPFWKALSYRVSHKSVLILFLPFSQTKFIQNAKVSGVLKNSGNFLHDRHKNFENWFRNSCDNWCHPWF